MRMSLYRVHTECYKTQVVTITSFSGGRVSMAIVMLTRAFWLFNVTEELHTRPYMLTKKDESGQNISIGSFHASFHNVSIYVK